MGQRQTATGSTGWEPSRRRVRRSTTPIPNPRATPGSQTALTVQGKIGNFDHTYAFGHLNRNVDSKPTYSDYGFWYDTLHGYWRVLSTTTMARW
jgi:hypothetical protein